MGQKKTIISKEALERKVVEYCYSRTTCRELEIDYCNIQEDDVRRIREYLLDKYYQLKDDKK